jgi:hypothetical protein
MIPTTSRPQARKRRTAKIDGMVVEFSSDESRLPIQSSGIANSFKMFLLPGHDSVGIDINTLSFNPGLKLRANFVTCFVALSLLLA